MARLFSLVCDRCGHKISDVPETEKEGTFVQNAHKDSLPDGFSYTMKVSIKLAAPERSSLWDVYSRKKTILLCENCMREYRDIFKRAGENINREIEYFFDTTDSSDNPEYQSIMDTLDFEE